MDKEKGELKFCLEHLRCLADIQAEMQVQVERSKSCGLEIETWESSICNPYTNNHENGWCRNKLQEMKHSSWQENTQKQVKILQTDQIHQWTVGEVSVTGWWKDCLRLPSGNPEAKTTYCLIHREALYICNSCLQTNYILMMLPNTAFHKTQPATVSPVSTSGGHLRQEHPLHFPPHFKELGQGGEGRTFFTLQINKGELMDFKKFS